MPLRPPIIRLDTLEAQKILFYALYARGYRWMLRNPIETAWFEWENGGAAKDYPYMYVVRINSFTVTSRNQSIKDYGEPMNSISHFLAYLAKWEKTQIE